MLKKALILFESPLQKYLRWNDKLHFKLELFTKPSIYNDYRPLITPFEFYQIGVWTCPLGAGILNPFVTSMYPNRFRYRSVYEDIFFGSFFGMVGCWVWPIVYLSILSKDKL
jgi:hypothetical protein